VSVMRATARVVLPSVEVNSQVHATRRRVAKASTSTAAESLARVFQSALVE